MLTKIVTLYLFIGILFLSIMSVYSLYRWKSGFAKALGALSLSLEVYLLGYILEINSLSLNDMLFWNQVQYFGIPFFPVIWLLVSMFYTGRINGLWDRKVALIFIMPILTFFFRITNGYHYLYYSNIELIELNGINLMLLTKGPLYFVQMSYVLICLIMCT